MNEKIKLTTLDHTLEFARQFSSVLAPGDVVFLQGDLGAGKTTLVRGILNALGHPGTVKSPTFTLVEPYHLNAIDIYHFDLYRLEDPSELEDIGFRDYVNPNSICLIEWPEKAVGYLPKPTHVFKLTIENQIHVLTR